MRRRRTVGAAIAFAFALPAFTFACGSPSALNTPRSTGGPIVDQGVSLAANSGPTLIVVSLDPAEPGENTLAVDVRDATGALIPGAVHVDVSLDGAPAGSVTLAAATRRGALAIGRAGHVGLHVAVLDGKSAGAAIALSLDLPAVPAAMSTLSDVDRTMLALHTLRETQTLTSGGPQLILHFEYLAPDRVRYTMLNMAGQLTETRLIGRDRFDREGGGPWTHTDLGFPSRVPYSAYANGVTRVRVIGHERAGDQDLVELAFVQAPGTYYRLWVGEQDHLAHRYVMMAPGHYMTGTYSDYEAPLAIAAP